MKHISHSVLACEFRELFALPDRGFVSASFVGKYQKPMPAHQGRLTRRQLFSRLTRKAETIMSVTEFCSAAVQRKLDIASPSCVLCRIETDDNPIFFFGSSEFFGVFGVFGGGRRRNWSESSRIEQSQPSEFSGVAGRRL